MLNASQIRTLGAALVAAIPAHYERDQRWQIKGYSVAADRYTIQTPNKLTVNINNSGYVLSAQANIDLSVAANWDSIAIDYTVALTRAGLDFYIYACQPVSGIIPVILLSANATVPTGYTADTSRKIGGFHCLCDHVGTIGGHTLTDFVAGDILPQSIWDLNFRARCPSNAGMVYDPKADLWVDIYLASSTGVNTASVNGATITDTRTWLDFVDDGGAVGKRLLRDAEFQLAATGGNEETNIYGSQDPVTAGKCAPKLFTGAGLNDLTANRTAFSHALGAQEYEIEIDATGTPDTFKWRQRAFAGGWGGYTTGVAIVGGAIAIADGFTVTFGATTGHTLGNKWNVYVMNGLRDTANRRMISNIGCEGMAGVMFQWLDEQNYRYDADTSPTFTTASKTLTAYHAASPGGNPIYLKYDASGIPYLCCNMATDAVDKILTFGSAYTVRITHDANAAVGSYQIYFDEDATQPARILCALPGLKNEYLRTSNPQYFLQVTYNAAPATPGVAINFDDGSDERLEFVSPTSANGAIDLAYITGPAWAYYDLPGTKGSLYRQGTYGDIKLLAGAAWNYGSDSGSRCRNANNYRWYTASALGGRFAVEPRRREP